MKPKRRRFGPRNRHRKAFKQANFFQFQAGFSAQLWLSQRTNDKLNSKQFCLAISVNITTVGGHDMSKHDDADLILKLYDLRREATMREARNWLFGFNPTSVQDIIDVLLSEHSGHYRMVISYWDMAAALVNNGAIDEKLFNETNGEHLFVYSKIAPLIPEIRTLFGNPEFLSNLETLVKRVPDYEEKITAMRERMKQFAAMREERTAKVQAAATATSAS
jgi:hypothetical protein